VALPLQAWVLLAEWLQVRALLVALRLQAWVLLAEWPQARALLVALRLQAWVRRAGWLQARAVEGLLFCWEVSWSFRWSVDLTCLSPSARTPRTKSPRREQQRTHSTQNVASLSSLSSPRYNFRTNSAEHLTHIVGPSLKHRHTDTVA